MAPAKGAMQSQMVVSIAMIICTLTIGRQMNYLRSKDLGYSKEQVVVVETNKSRKEGFPLANLPAGTA